jgi:flagellum-specific peptidoglycan hydrolase FlgJ
LYGFHRGELDKAQKDFFMKVIPFARKVQEWTHLKSSFLNIDCPRGVLTSITIADIILASSWGNHPISKTEYLNRYSNNLSLVEADDNWKGRVNVHEGKNYKAFKDWQEFSVSLSDDYCFSRYFDLVLVCRKQETQIQALSYTKPDYKAWAEAITQLISYYNLQEFNI